MPLFSLSGFTCAHPPSPNANANTFVQLAFLTFGSNSVVFPNQHNLDVEKEVFQSNVFLIHVAVTNFYSTAALLHHQVIKFLNGFLVGL